MMTTPTGWYPDPGDKSRERWWDASTQQWTGETRLNGTPAYAAAPPKQSRNGLIIGGTIIAVIVLIVGINAATDDDRSVDAAASSSTPSTVATTTKVETSTATVPAPTTTTATPIASCDTAPSQFVAIINASFNDAAFSLGTPAFSVTAPGNLVYISADILKDGVRGLSEAVWVAKGAAVFSLSGSARRTSLLPDGRDLLDANAGDDYGLRAQGCVGSAR